MARSQKKFNNIPFEYHTELELTIDNITNLGLGVGRHNGWVIMVPYVLPGEVVRVRIYRNHKNYSEADLIEIISPSEHRIHPQCPLFGVCGGCQYQHIKYKYQKYLKQKQVRELLLKLAKIDIDVNETISSEPYYNYRTKLTPHYQKELSKIGFLKNGSRFEIIDVETCPIATENINTALKVFREHNLNHSRKSGGTLLLRDTNQGIISDEREIVSQNINHYEFKFYAGEFFQNNPYILPKFAEYIISEAIAPECKYLIDAYCGVGVFGIIGSGHFEKVFGIEINENAIKLAKENAKLNNIKNIEFIAGKAENIFSDINLQSGNDTSVIIDPPRKGCDELFLSQLINYRPRKIVYVSCGPDTQARDAAFLLQNQYKIISVQPFDLFPQTRHIENVITFEREQ
jgi:23S rRNA (uracil1939-C5)-methyltransferase/tRNA (uracil-5-)-methyltransferase